MTTNKEPDTAAPEREYSLEQLRTMATTPMLSAHLADYYGAVRQLYAVLTERRASLAPAMSCACGEQPHATWCAFSPEFIATLAPALGEGEVDAIRDLFALMTQDSKGEWCFNSFNNDWSKLQDVLRKLAELRAATPSSPAPEYSEVEKCYEAVVDAAVEWRKSDEFALDKAETLESAVDRLLEFRQLPSSPEECPCGTELEAGLCPNGHDPAPAPDKGEVARRLTLALFNSFEIARSQGVADCSPLWMTTDNDYDVESVASIIEAELKESR